MKVKDIVKPFCTKNIFDSTICITVDDEEIIFNPGDTLGDLTECHDLGERTVTHCYVAESTLFVEVKSRRSVLK